MNIAESTTLYEHVLREASAHRARVERHVASAAPFDAAANRRDHQRISRETFRLLAAGYALQAEIEAHVRDRGIQIDPEQPGCDCLLYGLIETLKTQMAWWRVRKGDSDAVLAP